MAPSQSYFKKYINTVHSRCVYFKKKYNKHAFYSGLFLNISLGSICVLILCALHLNVTVI